MARIPVYTREVGAPDVRTANVQIDDSIARGIGNLAASVGQVAARFEERRNEQQDFDDDIKRRQYQIETDNAFADAQRAMPANATGFHDQFMASRAKPDEAFFSSISPRNRERFRAEWNGVAREKIGGAAADLEYAARGRYETDEIGKSLDTWMSRIASDPSAKDAAVADLTSQVTKASSISAEAKRDFEQKVKTNLATAEFRALYGSDPDGARQQLGIPSPNAATPTATGPGRVIQGQSGAQTRKLPLSSSLEGTLGAAAGATGLTVQVYSGGQPGKGEGGSRTGSTRHDHGNAADVYLKDGDRTLDFNNAQDRPRIVAFIQQAVRNGATGIGAGDGYMGKGIHVGYGPNGAKGGPVTVWGASGVGANAPEWLRDAVKNVAAAPGAPAGTDPVVTGSVQQQPTAGDPRWADIPYAQRLALVDRADSERAQLISAQRTAANQAAYEAKGAYSLGIQTGDIRNPQRILDDPYLRDADKAELISALRTRMKDENDLSAAQARIGSGQPLNPFNNDDKKAADLVYGDMTKNGQPPLDALQQVYETSKILPPTAVNGLRGAIGSPDVATAEKGLQVASSVMASNPNVFAGYDGGADIAKSATAFQHYTELGMSATQAARRVSEMNSPEYQRKNRVSDEDASAFVKKLGVNDVAASFGLQGSWASTLSFGMMGAGSTEIGANYEQRNAILSDYTELAEQRYRETGDEGAAKAYAKQVMSATYGVSDFDGRPVFMKFPPSKMYPPVPRASDGVPSIDYVLDQAAEAVKQVDGVDVAPADIILSPIPNVTARDWTSGRLPRYSVSYWRDENGQRVFETVHGQAFSADPKAAQDASEAARRSDWEGKTAQAKGDLKLANPLGNQTQRDNFERTNPVRQAVKALIPDPTGQGTPEERQELREAVGGLDRDSLMSGGEDVEKLRSQLPEAQQRILGAAIKAIASPGVDAKAITKRLRDAGIPESLWPSEVQ